MKAVSDQWSRHGFELDFSELVYTGERAEVAAYLEGSGWSAESITATDLLVRVGLPPADGDSANFADIRYVSAVR
jgi:O-methyltransferase involved in polyketide biosynthesis